MEESELLLMLGTDFPYKDWFHKNARIVQVDIRAERLGRRCRIDLGLIGDIKETISALLPLLEQKKDHDHLNKSLNRYRESRKNLDAHARGKKGIKHIHPEYLASLTSQHAADDAIFTFYVGEQTVWPAASTNMTRHRRTPVSFTHVST